MTSSNAFRAALRPPDREPDDHFGERIRMAVRADEAVSEARRSIRRQFIAVAAFGACFAFAGGVASLASDGVIGPVVAAALLTLGLFGWTRQNA